MFSTSVKTFISHFSRVLFMMGYIGTPRVLCWYITYISFSVCN